MQQQQVTFRCPAESPSGEYTLLESFYRPVMRTDESSEPETNAPFGPKLTVLT